MNGRRVTVGALVGVLVVAGIGMDAFATVPYGGAGGAFPGFGPGVVLPPAVGGKEFSHDRDYEVLFGGPPDTALDPQQIVAWDGVGGVVNVTDYTGTRPTYTPDDDIDAIANRGDFAYRELRMDDAHLLYSLDDLFHFVVPGAGFGGVSPGGIPPGLSSPFPGPGVAPLGNGSTVGGSGEVSFELGLVGGANPADTHGVWASQPEVNAMPVPEDVDGLEVWGPEPDLADADKYSLDIDALSGLAGVPATSVWNASGSPYVSHGAIVGAVTTNLGPLPPTAFMPAGPFGATDGEDSINLDALMVHDVIEDSDSFDRDPTGPAMGDQIIFSIRQIVDPMDPDGYYATGSELFFLHADGTTGFLAHGGHLWDHAYALATFGGGMLLPDGSHQQFALDINAIEAVGEFAVPEPATIVFVGVGLLTIGAARRRKS